MPKKRELRIGEVAAMGGHARARKYSKRQVREWGKLGGRPRKKDKKAKK